MAASCACISCEPCRTPFAAADVVHDAPSAVWERCCCRGHCSVLLPPPPSFPLPPYRRVVDDGRRIRMDIRGGRGDRRPPRGPRGPRRPRMPDDPQRLQRIVVGAETPPTATATGTTNTTTTTTAGTSNSPSPCRPPPPQQPQDRVPRLLLQERTPRLPPPLGPPQQLQQPNRTVARLPLRPPPPGCVREDGDGVEDCGGSGTTGASGVLDETELLAKLRCPSESAEVVAEREKRRMRRRCPDYPGLALSSSVFSTETGMKFSIIRNELHNVLKPQLRRVSRWRCGGGGGCDGLGAGWLYLWHSHSWLLIVVAAAAATTIAVADGRSPRRQRGTAGSQRVSFNKFDSRVILTCCSHFFVWRCVGPKLSGPSPPFHPPTHSTPPFNDHWSFRQFKRIIKP